MAKHTFTCSGELSLAHPDLMCRVIDESADTRSGKNRNFVAVHTNFC